MEVRLNGRVSYANGRPAAGVRVRVFDRDAPGKGDDDLTIVEGLSDADGAFQARFSPSRYLDWKEVGLNLPFDWTREIVRRVPDATDVYRPYLQFDYPFKGQPRGHQATLSLFKRDFRLPEMPPVAFKPSEHGLKFVNRFKGYFIPFSIPSIPDIPSVSNIYGMCGGMAATALDFILAGRPISPATEAPKRNTRLHRYLYRRQIDSFGPFGDQIVRFARWMMRPDDTPHGTWRKCLGEWEDVRRRLDDDNPLPIGLVYVSSRETLEIWQNHQVLAYGYRPRDDGGMDLQIYDPNYPLRDDVVVRCQKVALQQDDAAAGPLYGLRSEQWVGTRRDQPVRGFFAMPYAPVEPPAGL